MADFDTRTIAPPKRGNDGGQLGHEHRNERVGKKGGDATVVRTVPRLVRSAP